MSRRCIRFGEGHTMREAVWLLSEMTKGRRNPEGQPLFLQDARGKLAGKIGPRRMLEAMTECFEPGEMKRLDDAELGKRFRACFPTVVGDIARRRMPLLETNSTLGRLVWASQAYELRTLPVRDAEGRLAGLVCEEDLLRGFAEAVDFPMPETPKPESL